MKFGFSIMASIFIYFVKNKVLTCEIRWIGVHKIVSFQRQMERSDWLKCIHPEKRSSAWSLDSKNYFIGSSTDFKTFTRLWKAGEDDLPIGAWKGNKRFYQVAFDNIRGDKNWRRHRQSLKFSRPQLMWLVAEWMAIVPRCRRQWIKSVTYNINNTTSEYWEHAVVPEAPVEL